MFKAVLAIIGVAILLCAVMLALLARGPVPLPDVAGPAAGAGQGPEAPACDLEILTSKNPISERENVVLTVVAAPRDKDKACYDVITLEAPNFRIDANKAAQALVASAREGTSLPDDLRFLPRDEVHWLLAPEKSGVYKVAVQTRESYKVIEVAVDNTLGISPFLAQLFAGAGTVFGPILTIPWWLDRWRERREVHKEQVQPVAVQTRGRE